MMGLVVVSSPADEGGPLPYGKDLLLPRNVLLESLTWVNKGAAACYIQLHNSPRPLAVAITDTDDSTGDITAPNHGFVTGDKITLTGIDGMTGGYLHRVSADVFTVHETRANALANVDIMSPSTPNDTGTLDLFSNDATDPTFEEYPCLGAGDAPQNMGSYVNGRFPRGLYARAVTTQNGSILISGDDVKFTPRYSTGPIHGATYED